MAFAEKTTIEVPKTRAEIEALVVKYGATRFASGWTEDGRASISFACKGRLVRFTIQAPTVTESNRWANSQRGYKSQSQREAWIAQEQRRRWRCLLLAIKAKLEVVESGIATFEEEFLAHIVTADNLTVYEQIKAAEANGTKMLAAVGEGAG